jgi:hypothetical protein
MNMVKNTRVVKENIEKFMGEKELGMHRRRFFRISDEL